MFEHTLFHLHGVEEVLEFVELVQQLPASWLVGEGGKALLCQLYVEGGDQLCQRFVEGGDQLCQLRDEEGGDVWGDGQLCSLAGVCQAEKALPNSLEHNLCHNPSLDLLSAQHAAGPQTWYIGQNISRYRLEYQLSTKYRQKW